MIGRMIAHYRIIEKIGEGGMGEVFLAEDTKLGRRTALKFLSKQGIGAGDERERFLHEAQAAAGLNHPNISTVYEIEESPEGPFIAMEYIEGESLAARIGRGPLPLSEAIDIAAEVAAALENAHAHGIVHRDIKPANIMLASTGQAKVTDFGLAKLSGRTKLTVEGATLGTIDYMSPEQARGEEVDHRADIWSLGVVLYEMITGHPPFAADYDQARVYKILSEEPDPPTTLRTGVPMELERIILKALRKDPVERYLHADEMAGDLRALRAALTDTSHAGRMVSPAPGGAARGKDHGAWRWTAVFAVLAAAIVLGRVFLWPAFFRRDAHAAPKPIAVIAFENRTGDPAYDYLSAAIPNLLITSLEQSDRLQVTTWERLHDLLALAGRPPAEVIDTEVGFELCAMDGIDVIVTGSFVKAGGSFATEAKVMDVGTRRLLKTADARGEGIESIIDRQIDELARSISKSVGAFSTTVEQDWNNVAEVTTSSMEAYKYFLKGRDELEKIYYKTAGAYLERAIEIDSTFAAAHLYMGMTQDGLNQYSERDASYRAAMRCAGRASQRERLYIESVYANFIERDIEASTRLLEEVVSRYPNEKQALYYLALRYSRFQRHGEAIDLFERAIRLDPSWGAPVNTLAYEYFYLGRYREALEHIEQYIRMSPGDANPLDSKAEILFALGDLDRSILWYRRAIETKPDFYNSMENLHYVYGVKGDFDSALIWVDRYLDTVPSPGLRAGGLWWRSVYLVRIGRIGEAFDDLETASEFLKLQTVQGSWYYFVRLSLQVELERYHDAASTIAEAQPLAERVQLSVTRMRMLLAYLKGFVHCGLGLYDEARADLEDLKAARTMLEAQEMSRLVPVLEGLAPLLEAELLLAGGRPREAAALIDTGFAPGVPGASERMSYNYPARQDVQARALLALGDTAGAIEVYEKLIAFDPSSSDRRLRNPRYHYRAGVLYEALGRRERAAEHYGRFLEYMKRADADAPYVEDARRRLQALH